jgi:hypothetical protein
LSNLIQLKTTMRVIRMNKLMQLKVIVKTMITHNLKLNSINFRIRFIQR